MRARNKNERHLGTPLPRPCQRTKTVESRHAMVREYHIRPEMLEFVQKLVFSFDSFGTDLHALAEFMVDNLRVQSNVFNQQDAELSLHRRRKTSSIKGRLYRRMPNQNGVKT
jgi:hypothetical protein